MDSRSVKSNYTQVSDAFAQLAIGGRQKQKQCYIAKLPNEMLQAILRKVGEAFYLIKLRSVSTSWKQAIETICGEKKCLIVVKDLSFIDWYNLRLVERFNGHLESTKHKSLKRAVMKLSEYNCLTANICTLLANLFPQIEQFYIISEDISYASSKFNEMLKQWSSSLTTLSMRSTSYTGIEELCVQINELTNLKQLDFNRFPYQGVKLLAPTLNRLEHLSCRYYVIMYDIVADILRNLGKNFTSLGMNDHNVKIGDLTEWPKLNAQFVSNLERFSLRTYEPEVLAFICQNFSSLQVLRISMIFCNLTTSNIEQLAQLTNLLELKINSVTINLLTLDVTNLMSLNSIQTASLWNFKIVNDRGWCWYLKDGHQFSRVLSTIFPSVVKLTVKSEKHRELRNLLEQHVNLFVNLREHDFGLNDPIPEDDYDDGHVDYEDWTNSDD